MIKLLFVQDTNSDQDNVEEPLNQNQETVTEEQILQSQELMPLRRSTRERISALCKNCHKNHSPSITLHV